MVGGRSSEKRDGTTVARLEENSSRLGVLFEPLVFVDCTPCQDAPDYDSQTNGKLEKWRYARRNGVRWCLTLKWQNRSIVQMLRRLLRRGGPWNG